MTKLSFDLDPGLLLASEWWRHLDIWLRMVMAVLVSFVTFRHTSPLCGFLLCTSLISVTEPLGYIFAIVLSR